MTPPPNYDTALQILARSHESVLGKPSLLQRQSSTSSSFRRTFSFDLLNNNQTRQNNLLPFDETETNNTDKHEVGDNIRQNSDLTITVSWYRISMPFFVWILYIYYTYEIKFTYLYFTRWCDMHLVCLCHRNNICHHGHSFFIW